MKKIKTTKSRINAKERVSAYQDLIEGEYEMNSRLLLIQQSIPIGLMAVEEALRSEVVELAGEKYSRGGSIKRWGSNPGSVFLGNQKLSIRVPRLRDIAAREEVELEAYRQLQSPQIVDERVFSQGLNGSSTRKYETAMEKIQATFGISKSSVSRKFIKGSAKKLRELNECDLSDQDIIAIFIDGKSFADSEMIIALGVTLQGEKVILGMIESSTENHRVCRAFLQNLKEPGLRDEQKLLFMIDEAKGLRKGIKMVLVNKSLCSDVSGINVKTSSLICPNLNRKRFVKNSKKLIKRRATNWLKRS